MKYDVVRKWIANWVSGQEMYLRYVRIVSVLAPQVNDQQGPGQVDVLSYCYFFGQMYKQIYCNFHLFVFFIL